MSNAIPFVRVAENLDGTQRAKLFLKDWHQKKETKLGFLSDPDVTALLRMRDSTTKEEFDKCIKVYYNALDVMIRLQDVHICFITAYQELKIAHFRLGISRGLHEVSRIITNNIMKRLVTKDEYKKMAEDALNETVSVKELVDVETALSLIQQGKTVELEIDPYEPFDFNKVPFRCKDPEIDAELKAMVTAERAIQESKINEAIASGTLTAVEDRIRVEDWQKYPDKLDTLMTTELYDYWLVAERGKDERLTTDEQGELGLKRLLKEATKLLDIIQPIGVETEGLLMPDKVIIKNMEATRERIAELHQDACEILTLTCVANKITEQLGFDAFAITKHSMTRQTILENVMNSVNEHNNIVLRSLPRDDYEEMKALIFKGTEEMLYKEPTNLKDYLIADPTVNEALYKEWHEKIFR